MKEISKTKVAIYIYIYRIYSVRKNWYLKTRSRPESACCCARCVIPYGLFQSGFWCAGQGQMVRTLSTIGDGGVVLKLWGTRWKMGSSTWNNSLITGIYLATRAEKHALIFPSFTLSIEYICVKFFYTKHLHYSHTISFIASCIQI